MLKLSVTLELKLLLLVLPLWFYYSCPIGFYKRDPKIEEGRPLDVSKFWLDLNCDASSFWAYFSLIMLPALPEELFLSIRSIDFEIVYFIYRWSFSTLDDALIVLLPWLLWTKIRDPAPAPAVAV